MVVLRTWSGILFVTSPICRARWGSIDGRGRLFGRVTRAAFVPFASCRADAGNMSHRDRSVIAASSHHSGAPSRCRRGPGQKRGQILRSAPVARTKDTFRQQKNSFFVRLPGEKARVYKKIANFTARNFAYEALLLRTFSPLSFLRAWHISAGGADLSTPLSNECPHNGSKPL